MSTDLGPEFIEKYNAIENNLKKRFMRKPNVSEATEEFSNLALQCELAEQPQFAGICYLEAAKCERENSAGSAEHLLMSARQFMRAELKLSSLKCISPGRENLEAAISSFLHAHLKYPEKSPMRMSVIIELAEALEKLGHYSEAVQYYKYCLKGFNSASIATGPELNILSKIATIYLRKENYAEALKTFKIMDTAAKLLDYKSFIQRCEVNILLLYLIVQPTPDNVTVEANLIKKYTLCTDTESHDDEECSIHPELFLHLQSVLFACKTNDIKTLINLNTEMKNYLTIEQIDLMQTLISIYKSMM